MGSQEISLIQGGGHEDNEDNLLNASDTMNFFKSKSAHKRTNHIRHQNLSIDDDSQLHHFDNNSNNNGLSAADLDSQLVIRLDQLQSDRLRGQ